MSRASEQDVLPEDDHEFFREPESTEVLGKQVDIPNDPEAFEIHCVPNMDADRIFHARFTVPEFTSLCPITGQPDFATIIIDYVPYKVLIESKSLKLYMFSFRNHGAYHERVTNMIGQKLSEAANPRWLRVSAYFNPRGGIPIDVFYQFRQLPDCLSISDIPDHGIPVYRGR